MLELETQAHEAKTTDKKLLEVSHLKKYFAIEKGFFRRVVGYVKAVDDVSFYINEGEVFTLMKARYLDW